MDNNRCERIAELLLKENEINKIERVSTLFNCQDITACTADALAGYVLPAVKPDADNLAKAALDACNGIIWCDDALICSLLVKKRYAAYPCLEIKVVPEETALFGR